MHWGKMGKATKIFGIIGVIAVIAVIIVLYMAGIVGASPVPAYLSIESGNVQVNTGSGWTTATEGMKLSQDDMVKTGPGSKAVVIFYESAFAELNANTQITIAELEKDAVKINQDSGSTWNKVTKLAGLEDYEVETPTTVATVRGTEFGVNDVVAVADGNVDAKAGEETVSLTIGEASEVVDGTITKRKMTQEEIKKALANMQAALISMKKIRDQSIMKIPLARMKIKKLSAEDKAEYERIKDEVDNNIREIEDLISKAPVKTKRVMHVVEQTKKIRDQKEKIEKLRELLQ